jgi:hypothetical protein
MRREGKLEKLFLWVSCDGLLLYLLDELLWEDWEGP